MFSRRHPYLFFLLVFSTILAATLVVIGILIVTGSGRSELEFGRRVAIVDVAGPITDARETIEALRRYRRAEAVKAIVLRVNSPGGAVGPSQEIYREIRKTRKKKKVVASLGTVAASGGYYIAAAADRIVADPGTLTGSIGVIMGYTNVRQLLDKIGLSPVVIKSGRFKDIGSPVRAMTAEERKMLQAFADQIHEQFITAVADGRGLPQKKIRPIADGRIFSGQTAKRLGLVDRLGNLDDAVQWAGQLAGIQGPVESVREPVEKFHWLKYITETAVQKAVEALAQRRIYAAYLYRAPVSGAH